MDQPPEVKKRRGLKNLYKNYIYTCRKRNIFFSLTIEEFEVITSQPCTYCKKPPSQNRYHYIYSGIDRKANNQGYTLENSTACCPPCNAIKGAWLTADEMLAAMEVVMKMRRPSMNRGGAPLRGTKP